MISLSKWANQSESHSSGRELLVGDDDVAESNVFVGMLGFGTPPAIPTMKRDSRFGKR